MKIYFRYIFTAVVILFFSLLTGCESGLKIKENEVSYSSLKESNSSIYNNKNTESDVTSIADVYVYITGSVNKPGVYTLVSGCRINDVIDLAGGFREEADRMCINLASQVVDGMHIHIYSIYDETTFCEEMQGQLNAGSDCNDSKITTLVNINIATKEELMSLSGIGDSKAQKIINYREEYGRFEKKEDIMNVPGIKNAAYESIKDFICVD